MEGIAKKNTAARTLRVLAAAQWWKVSQSPGLLAGDGVADGEALATFGATTGQNLAAVGSGHSFAEAVLVHALAVVGLISTFHFRIWLFLFVSSRQFGRQS